MSERTFPSVGLRGWRLLVFLAFSWAIETRAWISSVELGKARKLSSPFRPPGLLFLTNPFGSSAWKQQPNESNAAYMKRLQQVASDPVAFERMALQTYQEIDRHAESTSSSTSSKPSNTKAGGGYQRAEDWDREQKEKRGQMSWEEKVQFDGQRFGDRFQQNEILRHNLRAF